jgi:hypothetical protein
MNQPERKIDVCQIQIQPVDNGFVVQAMGLDAAGRKARFVALDLDNLRNQLKDLIATLYEPVPEKAPPTAEAKAAPGGPAGAQSPS